MTPDRLNIVHRPIAELVPYARNARTHSEEQIAALMGVIREFGFLVPVLIDGDNGIIAGHGRVLAARRLDYAELPCIEVKHLSEAQKRAFILADNRIAERAGWDKELVRLELSDLADLGFDLHLTAFDPSEWTAFTAADDATPPDDFADYDEDIDTEHECPKCGYRFSGGIVVKQQDVDDAA